MNSLVAALVISSAAPLSTAAPVAPNPTNNEPSLRDVAAARELLLVMFPTAQRDELLNTVAVSMIRNMVAGGRQSNPHASDSRADAIINRFVADAEIDVKARLHETIPSLFEAYARAYARNFSADEMKQIRAFVVTPAGQKFSQRSQVILTDPDVQQWQRDEVADSFRRMAPRIAEMQKELAALTQKPGGGE